MKWPRRPAVYEINTRVWLADLTRRNGREVDLAGVPASEWDDLASFGFDAVRLLGVWERSPCSALIAAEDPGVVADARRALDDFQPEDLVGSPFAVHRHEVDGRLGGAEALAVARERLAQRSIRLVLDYVPDRTAVDHPWIFEHPEWFVRGKDEDLRRTPGRFFEAGGLVFAHAHGLGEPPGPDVGQLNVFSPEVRQAVLETLRRIARLCDGLGIPGASRALNIAFKATWGEQTGDPPAGDFWAEIIPGVRDCTPGFLFVAEDCGELAWELMQQGFDYCLDDRLCDRLRIADAEGVGIHLTADPTYQNRLVRFTGHRGEPRETAAFPAQRLRASAVVAATLPGAKLFLEGGTNGRHRGIPLALARRPDEPVDEELRSFFRTLLVELGSEALKTGLWQGCPVQGWPDNPTHRHLVAWCWTHEEQRRVVAVNLSDTPSQGLLVLPWEDLADRNWQLTDVFTKDRFARNGSDMRAPGLYVALNSWGFHLLRVEPK